MYYPPKTKHGTESCCIGMRVEDSHFSFFSSLLSLSWSSLFSFLFFFHFSFLSSSSTSFFFFLPLLSFISCSPNQMHVIWHKTYTAQTRVSFFLFLPILYLMRRNLEIHSSLKVKMGSRRNSKVFSHFQYFFCINMIE